MSNRPIIPKANDIVAPAQATLVAKRPRAFDAINLGQGVYAHIFEGIRAQAELAIARLADGVVGGTYNLAKGDQLKSLIASERELPPIITPTVAIGSCTSFHPTGSGY